MFRQTFRLFSLERVIQAFDISQIPIVQLASLTRQKAFIGNRLKEGETELIGDFEAFTSGVITSAAIILFKSP